MYQSLFKERLQRSVNGNPVKFFARLFFDIAV